MNREKSPGGERERVISGPLPEFVDLAVGSITLYGSRDAANAGRRLLLADTNGDGHPDLRVGGPLDPEVETRGGKVWLVHGPFEEGGQLDDLAAASIQAERGYEWLGQELASPGDLDGDSLPDLAVAAPWDYAYAGDLPGKVYLIHGDLQGTVTGADADLVLQGGHFGDWAGGGLATGFDLDGDGWGDLAGGAPMSDTGAAAICLHSYGVWRMLVSISK